MKAMRINETGGPEVMHLEEIETPVPGEGEVLIKVAAAGVNYADLAQRQGAYLTRTRTPITLGAEVAGTIASLGPGVSTHPTRRERPGACGGRRCGHTCYTTCKTHGRWYRCRDRQQRQKTRSHTPAGGR